MKYMRNTSINGKLTIVTMFTTTAALLLACASFVIYEQLTFRHTMVNNFGILAQMFGDNVASGLTFMDKDSMEDTLNALSAQPHVLAAAVYDSEARLVTKYERRDLRGSFVFPVVGKPGSTFDDEKLNTFQKIVVAGDEVGSVYIASDLTEINARLERYAVIMSVVLLTSLVAAFVISGRLRKIISEPISQLSKAAQIVAAEKNYSVRASKQADDELGRLTDVFNDMLEQIQLREVEIQKSQSELESRVEERTHELANTLSLVRATLEATTDGILVADRAGAVTNMNERFVEMWRIPQAFLGDRDDRRMLEFAIQEVAEPDQFLSKVQKLYAAPETESFDLIEFKDGRVFERYSKPQRLGDRAVGRVWSFRDVTERKRGEDELEKIHKELLETSRQAGMAEVATSVLHNVGNVLNSVNVSCSVISEKVRKMRISSVAKTAEVLAEHRSDLAEFLTNDPAGQKLPGYLAKLAERLAAERGSVFEELYLLAQNIEHIKDIIAVQQGYAKNIGGVRETLPVTDLVEDALRMNAAGLTRHHIEIVREFHDASPVSVEKHKVLQILVNLVRNAKHALTDGGHDEKRLILRVEPGESETVRISVCDNGIGIASENLTRVFSHGFTTKKDGHGFGLHSGVLAAQQMGGTLRAESAGPGCGATFTLELPRSRNGSKDQPAKIAEPTSPLHATTV